MMARLQLPKNKKDMAEALESELGQAEIETNLHLTTWRIIDAYLSGVRKFSVRDRFSGQIAIAYENIKGELEFRHEEILRMYLVECGRWMKADLTPFARKKGENLGAMRKAGIANAVLSSRAAKLPMGQLKRQTVVPFLKYGNVAWCHYDTGDPEFPDLVEVVPPRQVRVLPAWVDGLENVYGIARRRWVPYEWAKDRIKAVYEKSLGRYHLESDLQGRAVTWGSQTPGSSSWNSSPTEAMVQFPLQSPEDDIHADIMGRKRRSNSKDGGIDRDQRYYVPLEEIYVYDDLQTYVSHFIIKVGDVVVYEKNFEEMGLRVVCPLQMARHTDTGRAFGRGFVSPLLPFNDRIEKMTQSLFKNISEMDMFGTLFISSGMGVDIKKRWRSGPRPKVESYEVDPLSPGTQPMKLEPVNTGPLPAKFAEYALAAMQRLAGQGPYYAGETSGRVDSAAGLGFLFNTGNIALGLPSNGLADALAGVYQRMLQVAKDRATPGATIEMATVDDAIAGVIVNPATGEISLADNPIPDPWEVEVDIRDRTPRDPHVRLQELKEGYQMQLVNWTQFWITVLEENLEYPGAPKELWATWRKAIWQIILLFRDGQSPGPLVVGEHVQDANVQLIALQRFMNRIEFSLASPQVQGEFEKWKELLERLTGRNYPVGLPPPEAVAQARQKMEQQAAGGGGFPQGLMGAV
jgi:hypothetical protein